MARAQDTGGVRAQEEEEEEEEALWLQEKTSLQQAFNIEQTAAADRD